MLSFCFLVDFFFSFFFPWFTILKIATDFIMLWKSYIHYMTENAQFPFVFLSNSEVIFHLQTLKKKKKLFQPHRNDITALAVSVQYLLPPAVGSRDSVNSMCHWAKMCSVKDTAFYFYSSFIWNLDNPNIIENIHVRHYVL